MWRREFLGVLVGTVTSPLAALAQISLPEKAGAISTSRRSSARAFLYAASVMLLARRIARAS
jgi:hypothetical protein